MTNNLQKIIQNGMRSFEKEQVIGKANSNDLQQKVINELNSKYNSKTINEKIVLQTCHNIEDVQLLKEKSNLLIQKYQHYVKHLLNKYIRLYYIDEMKLEQYYWLLENINARLIEKMLSNKLNFQGRSLFSVYLYQVIKNIIIDELKKHKKKTLFSYTSESFFLNFAKYPQQNIQEAALIYPTLLNLEFNSRDEKNKFILLSKIIHRICLTPKDLEVFSANLTPYLSKDILSYFGQNYALMSKNQMWQLIEVFLAELTQKKRTSRTLKTWFKQHRNNILRYYLKNTPLPIPDNSKGELERLLDEYFERMIYKVYVST